MEYLLDIRDLSVDFMTMHGPVAAVRNVSVQVPRGASVGIVGESGSGKTTVVSSAMRLLPRNAVVRGGEIMFDGQNILKMGARRLRSIRGDRMSMVFQDPMTSLSPVLSIERQMIDVQYRDRASLAVKRDRAAAMLSRVGIPDAMQRLRSFPQAFSGGMRQRIAIAMALLNHPDLLIADEPTTALDVTLEAQIIQLLRELRREFSGSILFISHNLGVIAELCDYVLVMYAGEMVEKGTVYDIFHRPRHPYTRALLACNPARIETQDRMLPTIGGEVPDLSCVPPGCVFASRCTEAIADCRVRRPETTAVSSSHSARCHLLS